MHKGTPSLATEGLQILASHQDTRSEVQMHQQTISSAHLWQMARLNNRVKAAAAAAAVNGCRPDAHACLAQHSVPESRLLPAALSAAAAAALCLPYGRQLAARIPGLLV